MTDQQAPGHDRGRVTVEVLISPADRRTSLESDVREGLTSHPRTIPPTWFYDDRGSQLFDAITELAEYYPTRTERAILEAHAKEIAALSGADTLVELGSGTSTKTRLLLDALSAANDLARFCPFDVSEETLRNAAVEIAAAYEGLEVHAVVGDFNRHLGELPRDGRRMIAFLGGTIGNLAPQARKRFFFDLESTMVWGDTLLLGTDLVKDPARLVAAYDDSAGVTAEFNRNVLCVLNHELGGDFDPAAFDHVARWNAEEQWIEMRLRSRRMQHARLGALDLELEIGQGEEILTEISAKFTRERILAELAEVGLCEVASFSDPAGDYLLTLTTPYC